jgi:hypothetical protein
MLFFFSITGGLLNFGFLEGFLAACTHNTRPPVHGVTIAISAVLAGDVNAI